MPEPPQTRSSAALFTPAPAPPGHPAVQALFTCAFGGVLGLALLKFGNPVILDRMVERPGNGWEWFFQPWPLRYGYFLLGLTALLALPVARFRATAPRWITLLPWVWLAWQCVSAAQSVDPALTRATVPHFTACVLCWSLGLYALAPQGFSCRFQLFLLAALGFVLWTGFEQHYGGLEATRRMFYAQPNWREFPPEYLKKIESNRIFSTLVYPNALATAILLVLPVSLVTVWKVTKRLTDASRAVLVGVLAYSAMACLYWSGSKSGWLIALVLGIVTVLRQRLPRWVKLAIVVSFALCGLAGFYAKYAGYFRKGAPSVSARFDYWKAGGQTALAQPILGAGPGTFGATYRAVKPPEAEMAQLAHNDYLEQASDSGLLGALSYGAFVLGSVCLLPRWRGIGRSPETFAVWLGLLGWALQSWVEFPLYIPALAWTAFAFLGWLWGLSPVDNRFDRPKAS